MRLIDADEILKSEHQHYDYMSDEYYVLVRDIENASIIDAEPVRHGHWIYKGKRGRFPVCECSKCGNTENADWAILGDNVNYCPNCGARMDEVKNDT